MDIDNLRREYQRSGLSRSDLDADPFIQFERWLKQALDADLVDATAMSIATASKEGAPTLRTVLLKYVDRSGFVFFTNLESLKARQIAENPQVALLFYWREFERQVSITGRAERVSSAESLGYFLKRPRNSQLGAWVSQQSSVISSRQFLEQKLDEMRRKFSSGEIPLPSFWGGFRVVPETIEFWQGRSSRLHDRFRYQRSDDGWKIDRLAP